LDLLHQVLLVDKLLDLLQLLEVSIILVLTCLSLLSTGTIVLSYLSATCLVLLHQRLIEVERWKSKLVKFCLLSLKLATKQPHLLGFHLLDLVKVHG
jgi:hypothetical protein